MECGGGYRFVAGLPQLPQEAACDGNREATVRMKRFLIRHRHYSGRERGGNGHFNHSFAQGGQSHRWMVGDTLLRDRRIVNGVRLAGEGCVQEGTVKT